MKMRRALGLRRRLRLLGEVCERLEGSGVWIHELGASPGSHTTLHLPIHSFDATNWLDFQKHRYGPATGLRYDSLFRHAPVLLGLRTPRHTIKGQKISDLYGESHRKTAHLGLLAEAWRGAGLAHLWASRQKIGTPPGRTA